MTEQKPKDPEGLKEYQTPEVPARPDLTKAGPEVKAYLEWAEQQIAYLKEELESNPAQDARGIVWADCFGWTTGPDGNAHQVKINFTARSNVSPTAAMRSLLATLGEAKKLGIYPYIVEPPRPAKAQQPPAQAKQPAAQPPAAQAPQPPAGATAGSHLPPKSGPAPQPPAQQQATPPATGGRLPPPPGAGAAAAGGGASSRSLAGAWIKVTALQVDLTNSGEKLLRVKSPGKFGKFGAPAYLDSSNMPPEIVAVIESGEWAPKVEYKGDQVLKDYFPTMLYAQISDDEKRVVGFAAAPPTA